MSFFKMAKIITRNLFKSPATRKYPFTKRSNYSNTRGKIDIQIENCIHCSICQKRCPTGAITVNRTDKEWTIDPFGCISCGYCIDVCPTKCLSMNNQYSPPASTKEKEIHKDARVPYHTANH